MELLFQTASFCFKADYQRGCLECFNALIRCCTNAHDINILKLVYQLQSDCYIQFRDLHLAISCLERYKDLITDEGDYEKSIYIYRNLATCYTRMKQNQKAMFCY